MSTKLLILKLVATLAAPIAGGCNMPSSVVPRPINTTPATKHTVEITVSGTGQVNVAGNADLNVKNAAPDQPRPGACDCGCNHSSISDCEAGCPRRAILRTSSPSKPPAQNSAPQSATSKPVVTMYTSFADRSCGPCEAAKDAWKRNGKSWPFALKIVTQPGWTSPTFVWGTREDQRVVGFAGEEWLIREWQGRQ